MLASRLSRRFAAGLAATICALLVIAPSAFAQGKRTGHVKHHASANPPPGHEKGKGKGHQKEPNKSLSVVIADGEAGVLVAPAALAAASRAASGMRMSLREGSFSTPEGDRLPADAQTRLLGVLGSVGGNGAGLLATSLAPADNRVAAAEAQTLAQSVEGLLDHPETLPRAATAFNAFVDQSSVEFLSDPPVDFLVIHAVMTSLLETQVTGQELTSAGGR